MVNDTYQYKTTYSDLMAIRYAHNICHNYTRLVCNTITGKINRTSIDFIKYRQANKLRVADNNVWIVVSSRLNARLCAMQYIDLEVLLVLFAAV